MQSSRRWWVIVPVKPAAFGKSRLRPIATGRVRAIARDTVRAALRSRRVHRVIVVTADRSWGRIRHPRMLVVTETAARGIASAVARGAGAVRGRSPVAVLVGDLPRLDPVALDVALDLALGYPRAFVPDADGAGTTLVTARAGVPLRAAFGPASALRHRALGLVELPIPVDSTLRQDVDTPEQLAAR